MADITYTITNEFEFDHSEVVGIHAAFAEGSVQPANIYNCYFARHEMRQLVGYGVKFRNSYHGIRYVTTLANVNGSGDAVTAGTLRIEYISEFGQKHTLYDDGNGSIIDPNSLLQVATINYATGDLDLMFDWFSRPKANYGRYSGQKVYAYWTPQASNYPTQWTVTRTWGDGSVKQAKAWIGEESGSPLFIPAAKPIDIYVSNGSGSIQLPSGTIVTNHTRISTGGAYETAQWNGTNQSGLNLFEDWEVQSMVASGETADNLYGDVRLIVKQIQDTDSTYNTTNLPVYAENAELAAKMAVATSLRSEVQDNSSNSYRASIWDSTPHEESVFENPNFGGSSNQGWMKVTQRRLYHTPRNLYAHEAQRDLLSMTAYTYVPHNSRMAQVEMRLANDYRGHDPMDFQFTQAVTLGTGATTVNLTHAHNGQFNNQGQNAGSTDFPSIKKCSVELLATDGRVLARDHYGDGNIIQMHPTDRDLPRYSRNRSSGANELFGTVNYETGIVTIQANYPGNLVVDSVRYRSYTMRVGSVNGTNPTAQTFDNLSTTHSSQYSLRVRVGKTSILAEGWDAGGVRDTQVGYLAPFKVDDTNGVVVDAQVVESAGSVTTTYAFNLGQTNIHPGSVKFELGVQAGPTRNNSGRNGTWAGNTVYLRDNGNGGLGTSRGVSAFSIDYAAGTGSITFSGAPDVSHNLYSSYRADGATATPISGSWDRDAGTNSTGRLTLNLQGTFSNDDVYISYFPNALRSRGFYHDPNVHALGDASFAQWQVNFDADLTTHMEGVDWRAMEQSTTSFGLQNGNIASDGSSNIYKAWVNYTAGVPRSYRIWDARFDIASGQGSGEQQGSYGYMADGSSMYRNFFVYANNGATATEDNYWKAKKRAHLHGIPTDHTQRHTKALTVFEMSPKRVTPRMNSEFDNKGYANNAAWDEESQIHKYAPITRPHYVNALKRNNNMESIFAVMTSATASDVRYADKWQDGLGEGPSDSNGNVRPNFNWFENFKQNTAQPGAPRISHNVSQNILFTGTNSGPRFLTHAGMWPLCRSGMAAWSAPDSFNYKDDTFRRYIGQDASGKYKFTSYTHPGWTTAHDTVGWTHGGLSLRGRSMGYQHGFEGSYDGSTSSISNVSLVQSGSGTVIRVAGNLTASGNGSYPGGSNYQVYSSTNPYGDGRTSFGIRFGDAGPTSGTNGTGNAHYNTFDGERSTSGYMTRCTIAGSDKYHNLVSATYNSATNTTDITISPAYTADPGGYTSGVSGPLSWNLVSDFRTGQDTKWIRNDPRTFPTLRNGIYTAGDRTLQSGIWNDVTSHQAHYAGYDAWNLTGEWSVWDQIRFIADWSITDVKDIQSFGSGGIDHYENQKRSNFWDLRNMAQAFDATKHLQTNPAFTCLTDYGSGLEASGRYKDYLKGRIRSYIDYGASGQSDPNGNIATGRRTPITDIIIGSSSSKSDWQTMAKVGTKITPYGDGTFTEGELVYGQGYNYVSAWEFGYGHVYAGAVYRMLKDDATVTVFNNRKDMAGSPETTLGDIVWRWWDGMSRFVIGYGFIDRSQLVCSRVVPGLYRTSRRNVNITVDNGSVFNSGLVTPDGFNSYTNGVNTQSLPGSYEISPTPYEGIDWLSATPLLAFNAIQNPALYGINPNNSQTWNTFSVGPLTETNFLEDTIEDVYPVEQFPIKSFNRHYIASQAYYLRGAPAAITGTARQSIQSDSSDDWIGHPVINPRGEEITLYGNDSTFDQAHQQASDDTVNDLINWPPTSWHFAGDPGFSGSQTPTAPNVTPPQGLLRVWTGGCEVPSVPASEFLFGDYKASTRPPKHAEAFVVSGDSFSFDNLFTSVLFTGLPLVYNYHPDAHIAARAGDLLNRHIRQGIAISKFKQNRISRGSIRSIAGIDTNLVGPGVTGGYPYEDDPTQITTGIPTSNESWALTNFFRRRLLSGNVITSAVTADDVFIIDFNAAGIPSSELMDADLRDAVVVVQSPGGINEICQCRAVNTSDASGGDTVRLYVRFPGAKQAGWSFSENLAQERWYLYTTATSGLEGLTSWTNKNNTSAPFGTSAGTAIFWTDSMKRTQISNVPDVANYLLNGGDGTNYQGAAATQTDGKFAAGWSKSAAGPFANIGILSEAALEVVNTTIAQFLPDRYLGDTFTLDFAWKPSLVDLMHLYGAGFSAQSMGLFSIQQRAATPGTLVSYPLVIYAAASTGKVNVVYNGADITDVALLSGGLSVSLTGTESVSRFTVGMGSSRQADQVKPYWIGSTDGALNTKVENGVITNYGSVTVSNIVWANVSEVSFDVSTVPTGDVHILFFNAELSDSVNNTIVPDQWTNIRVRHSGTALSLHFNGNDLGSIVTSEPIQTLSPFTSTQPDITNLPDALSWGALWSTDVGGSLGSRGDFADLRLSLLDEGATTQTLSAVTGSAIPQSQPDLLGTLFTHSLSASAQIRAVRRANLVGQTSVAVGQTASLTCDGSLVLVRTSAVTADADVAATLLASVVVDGSVQATYTADLTCDASIATQEASSLTVDAGVQIVSSSILNMEGGVEATLSRAISGHVRVAPLYTRVLPVAASVATQETSSFISDQSIATQESHSLAMDGNVQAGAAASILGMDATVQTEESDSLAVDGYVVRPYTHSLAANGTTGFAREDEFFCEFNIAKLEAHSLNFYGFVEVQGYAASITANGYVAAINSLSSVTVDASVAAQEGLNLALQGSVALPLNADLVSHQSLAVQQTSPLTSDGYIQTSEAASLALEGTVQITRSHSLECDGVISSDGLEEKLPVYGTVATIKTVDLTYLANVATREQASLSFDGTVGFLSVESRFLVCQASLQASNTSSLFMEGNIKAVSTQSLYMFGYISADTGITPTTSATFRIRAKKV